MANIIPAQSSEFEGAGTDAWAAWFGCTISKTTEDAHSGTGSLRVAASEAFAGVHTDNVWPGWTGVTAGQEYQLSWWARGPVAASATWTATFNWRDDGGANLATIDLPITTDALGAWTEASAASTAPTGATRLFIQVTSDGSTSSGEVFYFDSFVADDDAGGGEITGSGTVTAPAASVSGIGTVEVTGSGASVAPVALLDGAGTVVVAGQGVVTPRAATVAGSGTVPVAGAGQLTAAAATVAGVGNLGDPPVTGSGAATSPPAQAVGTGTVLVTGAGQATAPAATVSGTGNVRDPVDLEVILFLPTLVTVLPDLTTVTAYGNLTTETVLPSTLVTTDVPDLTTTTKLE